MYMNINPRIKRYRQGKDFSQPKPTIESKTNLLGNANPIC